MTFQDIAIRVKNHWDGIFQRDDPLYEEICEWYGEPYPTPVPLVRRTRDQGFVTPETDFAECISNARSYAGPHLLQLATVLDSAQATNLRQHLTGGQEVIVIDVGCAAGILSLFADRCGFAHYIGIDTNSWMRRISDLVLQTTFNTMVVIEGYSPRPDHGEYGYFMERPVTSADSGLTTLEDRPTFTLFDGLSESISETVRQLSRVAQHRNISRNFTVLVVLNHILFQPSQADIERLIRRVLELCVGFEQLNSVTSYLISIEPGALWKPARFGTQGFDNELAMVPAVVQRFPVVGLTELLTGRPGKDAVVRLVRFGS